METPTGQEETAILLEEQARRIATLQESLKQACHNPHSNDRVILQEVDRLVKERDDLKRKLGNAEMLIEKLKEEVGHWEEDFAMFDRAHEKAIDLWRKEHPDAGHTPDMSDLNEWIVGRLERAEAVKESLTSALGQFVEAYHKALAYLDKAIDLEHERRELCRSSDA
jgi:tetratricopeptide (TPR) repeat protein